MDTTYSDYLKQHKRIVKGEAARKYKAFKTAYFMGYEDWESEAMFSLYEGCYLSNLTDPRLIRKRIRWDLVDKARQLFNLRQKSNILVENSIDSNPVVARKTLGYEQKAYNYKEKMEGLAKHLTPYQMKVISLSLMGWKRKEIGEVFGYSGPKISQDMARIKARLTS